MAVEQTTIIDDWLNTIGKYEVLTREQEQDICLRIELGQYAQAVLDKRAETNSDVAIEELEYFAADGACAKDEMFNHNFKLVVSMAKRFQLSLRNMTLMDIIQEGNLALMEAVRRFDYTKGNKFSTYATWWIRQHIQRGMVDGGNRPIRFPNDIELLVNKMNAIRRRVEETQGVALSTEELAAEMGCTPEKAAQLQGYVSQQPVSLDKIVGEDDTKRLLDFVLDAAGQDALDQIFEGDAWAEDALRVLDPVECRIFVARAFYADKKPPSWDMIAEHNKCSRRTAIIRFAAAKTKLLDYIQKMSPPMKGSVN